MANTNKNKKGYTSNILALIQEKQKNTECCLDFLTEIVTEDSATVTFTGSGTESDPLIATASAGSITPINGLSTIGSDIGLGGDLIQDTTIDASTGGFSITISGVNGDSVGTSIVLNPNDLLPITVSNDASSSLTGIGISNAVSGTGAAAGVQMTNDLGDTGFFYLSSSANSFVTRGVVVGNVGGIGGLNLAADTGPITFNSAFSQPLAGNEYARFNQNGHFGLGINNPSAILNIKAGTAAAGTAPIKLTSGPLLTTPEVGAVEFLTDKYFGTITTAGIRKEFTMNDVALPLGRVPFTGTNGRLVSSPTITYSTGVGLVVSNNQVLVSDGSIAPDVSAQLEVNSTTLGFLPPRMSTVQKNAIITPGPGLLVYDVNLNKLCVFTGSVWETITSA